MSGYYALILSTMCGPCTMHRVDHVPCTMYHIMYHVHHVWTMYHALCAPCVDHVPCTMCTMCGPCTMHRVHHVWTMYRVHHVHCTSHILYHAPCTTTREAGHRPCSLNHRPLHGITACVRHAQVGSSPQHLDVVHLAPSLVVL